jgi:hypothetical protein
MAYRFSLLLFVFLANLAGAIKDGIDVVADGLFALRRKFVSKIRQFRSIFLPRVHSAQHPKGLAERVTAEEGKKYPVVEDEALVQ